MARANADPQANTKPWTLALLQVGTRWGARVPEKAAGRRGQTVGAGAHWFRSRSGGEPADGPILWRALHSCSLAGRRRRSVPFLPDANVLVQAITPSLGALLNSEPNIHCEVG